MSDCRWVSLDELAERRGEWARLAGESSFPNAYNDPAWILAWWRHYGDKHEPWCLVFEGADGALRGLAALARSRSSSVRRLSFAGGAWNGLETLLCAPGMEEELTSKLLEALAARHGEWDVWRIERLPSQSRLANQLLGDRGPLFTRAHDVRLQPFLALPADAAQFESRFTANQRSTHRRKWRRLLERGAQPRLLNDSDDVEAGIRVLLQLRRERASAQKQTHAHMDARFERFLVDVVRDLTPQRVRLWQLELDGTTLAARLSLVEGPREHGYIVGLGREHIKMSPGTGLERHAILTSIDEGRAEFEFGPGRDKYKYEWGATDREVARLVVASPARRGRMLATPAAIDVRLRASAAAESLRRRRGVTTQRAPRDQARADERGARSTTGSRQA